MPKEARLIVGERFNIKILRGDSLTVQNAKFLVKYDDGSNVDLSGYDEATFVLTSSRTATPALSATKTAAEIVLGDGFWNLNLLVGTDIPAIKYMWQMKVSLVDGTEYTIGYGIATVDENSID
jgi:hypothetical protein